jgi:pilus assembly protein Flp/PilA
LLLDHPAKEEEIMLRLWTAMQIRFTDEEGASLVEYALLVALIAIVAIIAITAVGTGVSDKFSEIDAEL